jgi:hypothetical protein
MRPAPSPGHSVRLLRCMPPRQQGRHPSQPPPARRRARADPPRVGHARHNISTQTKRNHSLLPLASPKGRLGSTRQKLIIRFRLRVLRRAVIRATAWSNVRMRRALMDMPFSSPAERDRGVVRAAGPHAAAPRRGGPRAPAQFSIACPARLLPSSFPPELQGDPKSHGAHALR